MLNLMQPADAWQALAAIAVVITSIMGVIALVERWPRRGRK